ncbi:prepilin-type N-terminal cleavage/methylation domain-containing protein [Methylobacter sp.]|uniref:type IV pilus modification PilV family protein n=1 Tax=Methylobacter sp. TaxID=2051955 RepID=UPI0012286E3A|nr:prepilin-type N-terminal cleavage/methylation domain-containing protein [Methylobacter sp.]TAK62581.1 MAG: prepilin-type N-terminal cleavage/methylation domain-containing protein [Methylobacter sp.]
MKANKQRGFSLLEILIAFSILALSLGILLKIFSGGVNTAGAAEDYTAAVQIAESLMAQTGVESPLQQGEDSGSENNKYHWRVSVTPFQFVAEDLDVTAITAVLFKVKVTVNWGDNFSPGAGAASRADGRQVELITLKLANKKL